MNEAMIKRAREAAEKYGYNNVEFRLGEIEALPVNDSTVDAIISNCVINLSTDKPRVFRESYRVMKSGGRITVSDIVTNGELPESLKKDLNAWASCIGGALPESEYINYIKNAGFKDIKVLEEAIYESDDPQLEDKIKSITVEAFKP